MDLHFAQAEPAQNLPLMLGLVDVWYRNFHGFGSRSIAPYHHGLRRLPAYLQQLEMESNGKWVDREGRAMSVGTSPVLWGEPGTNGQHSYFQMLHQGTDRIPVEFIVVAQADHPHHDSHRTLLSNALAQSRVEALERAFVALGLTERQADVLKLILQGMPNKLIGRQLQLAEGTVKVHVSAVLRALGVRNRTQAVLAANRLGLKFND
jgi:glucose-6-phosphate isomerase